MVHTLHGECLGPVTFRCSAQQAVNDCVGAKSLAENWFQASTRTLLLNPTDSCVHAGAHTITGFACLYLMSTWLSILE